MSGAASHELPRAFGPYELVRQLGVGGMAEVYVARARSVAGFEKVVALKTIHSRFSMDPEFTQLLVDEANITAQLSHRNIVQVIDLGQVDGTHYIAMEFVDGSDLARLLTAARERKIVLSPRVAAYICREVADGLEHAHKKSGADGKPLKIVHRDVSPPNILVSTSGEVKITDFGIAKASLRAVKTGAGVVRGKYAYMAPEQARAQPIDHRVDIFSLGCVLYELATGKPVYPDSAIPILLDRVARVVYEPPEKLRPGLPPKLVEVIKKALSVRAEDRFQSARQMADALTDLLFTMPPNPEAELAAVHAELTGTPSTPSIPPVAAGHSILDDDFDDSTQIESMSVMRSRMVPGAPIAPNAPNAPNANPSVTKAPSSDKPTFRDEATRAFKRVGGSISPAAAEEIAPEDAPDNAVASSDHRAAPTLAPPPRAPMPPAPGPSSVARVRSPGAASKTAPPPPRPPATTPPRPPTAPPASAGPGTGSSAGPDRAASTVAPPTKSKPEPAPPQSPQSAPFIAPVTPLATNPPVSVPAPAQTLTPLYAQPTLPATNPPIAVPRPPTDPFAIAPAPAPVEPPAPRVNIGLVVAGSFAVLGLIALAVATVVVR